MDWFRWHNGTVNDPKWRVVARRSGARLTEVVAVWGAILENANQSPERGSLDGWNDEVVGAGLDIDTEVVVAIREGMQGLVLDGDNLTGWSTRNAKREDSSRDRVRAYRERKRTETKDPKDNNQPANVTPGNADVTHGNANGALEEIRGEKIREEDNNNTSSSLSSAAAVGRFCEMTGARWRLQAGIRDWAAEIEREPRYAGVDIPYEVVRCAEWHQGKRRTPKAPDLSIRNWLERAAEDLESKGVTRSEKNHRGRTDGQSKRAPQGSRNHDAADDYAHLG